LALGSYLKTVPLRCWTIKKIDDIYEPSPEEWLVAPTFANAKCWWSTIPIAVPKANVSAKTLPKVTSFGCADIAFRSLCFIVIVNLKGRNFV